jgi:hypothetical protein
MTDCQNVQRDYWQNDFSPVKRKFGVASIPLHIYMAIGLFIIVVQIKRDTLLKLTWSQGVKTGLNLAG